MGMTTTGTTADTARITADTASITIIITSTTITTTTSGLGAGSFVCAFASASSSSTLPSASAPPSFFCALGIAAACLLLLATYAALRAASCSPPLTRPRTRSLRVILCRRRTAEDKALSAPLTGPMVQIGVTVTGEPVYAPAGSSPVVYIAPTPGQPQPGFYPPPT